LLTVTDQLCQQTFEQDQSGSDRSWLTG